MQSKLIASGLLAAGLALSAVAAHAQGNFATLAKTHASAMTAEQMAGVEGKAHIYFLVEFRGVEVSESVETVLRAAAPTPNGGDFVRSPSREATAFDFLN